MNDHRQTKRGCGREDRLGAGHVSEAGEHNGRRVRLGDLGLGELPRDGCPGKALVGAEGGFFDEPDCRSACGARPRQSLDEGDGLGGAELVGEDQEARGGRGREGVAVGGGLRRGLGCRHGIWTPFAAALYHRVR